MFGMRKLEPQTAEEVKEAETPEGMRRRLVEYARDDSLTHHVFCVRYARGLSGEDTMTLLAYHALLERERFREHLLEFYNTQPAPRITVPSGRK